MRYHRAYWERYPCNWDIIVQGSGWSHDEDNSYDLSHNYWRSGSPRMCTSVPYFQPHANKYENTNTNQQASQSCIRLSQSTVGAFNSFQYTFSPRNHIILKSGHTVVGIALNRLWEKFSTFQKSKSISDANSARPNSRVSSPSAQSVTIV